MPTTGRASRNLSLPIAGLGFVGMCLSWVFTPRYGPWVANTVTAIPVLFAALFWGETTRNLRLSSRACVSSIAVGLALWLSSWLMAPIAIRLAPSLAAEMRQLYATLDRPPGPLNALPILLLTAATEEIVWRGEFVTWLRKRASNLATVALATVCYALPVAASQSMLLFAVALGLGAILTTLRLYTSGWVAPLIAHWIWALGVFVVRPIWS